MKKVVSRAFCASNWLMFRTVVDRSRCFAEGIQEYHMEPPEKRTAVQDSRELEEALRREMAAATAGGKTALALSGGIDSAILARMMPRGSPAYTFKCVVPAVDVVDETPMAARYARECGLDHRVVEVRWEDMERLSPILMSHKGSPCHSIEIQVFKAAVQALGDGAKEIVFGESADIVYGGMSGLLSKDWTFGEFVDRYSYVLPYKALRDFVMVTQPYEAWARDGYADVHGFLNETMYEEAINSYANACATAGITLHMPYSKTVLGVPLDIARVRRGENKYLVREVFERLYPGWQVPVKIPMARPLNEWFKKWEGPRRAEFWPRCTDSMTGDQKWYVYALERFLEMLDDKEKQK